LDNKFNDKQWVLDIKTAAHMGAEVTQADIDLQLNFFNQYLEPTLHLSTLPQTQETLWWCAIVLLIGGAVRLLQQLAFQRLLATLTDTIITIRSQLVHTFIILLIMMAAFACVGHVILSRQIEQFATLSSGLEYMFFLTFGLQKLVWLQCQNIGAVGTAFSFGIKIVVIGIVLKMMTSLIITGYKAAQKEDAPGTRGLLQDLWIMFYMYANDNLGLKVKQTCRGCDSNAKAPPLHLHDINQIFDHHAYFLEFCRDATSFLMKKENEDWGFKLGIPDVYQGAFIDEWDCKKREFSVTEDQSKELIAQAMTKYNNLVAEEGAANKFDIQTTRIYRNWIWKKFNINRVKKLLGPAPKAKAKKA